MREATGLDRVGTDGTVRVDAFELPPSDAWSEAARRVFQARARGPAVSVQAVVDDDDEEAWLASVHAFRTAMEGLHRRLLERIAADHPCHVVEDSVGGVPVRWVTPVSGGRADARQRVLVNLHGGAFVGGAEHCGLVESFPVADTGGYRVCVVDYRQGWEHRFPAASEDVAAVLGALAEERDPRSTGVFGYSAGGLLTAQAVAWLLDRGRPLPGAVALCSAGAGGFGDSVHVASRTMGEPPVSAGAEEARTALGGAAGPARFGYAAGVDPTDPLFAPVHAPDVLAAFPPTLLLSGTRSFDLSGVLRTHRALLTAGAEAELHVWEGMWHCFPYNHRMPEARDAVATLVGFFDRHLS